MGLYKSFGNDADLEKDGIILDYGFCRIRVARLGGTHKKFEKRLAAALKPHRRALQTNTMDEALQTSILCRVVAETCVKDWETRNDVTGDYERGIENPDPEVDELLPFTAENVEKTFKLLPDLFEDLLAQGKDASLYRSAVDEADSGNSSTASSTS